MRDDNNRMKMQHNSDGFIFHGRPRSHTRSGDDVQDGVSWNAAHLGTVAVQFAVLQLPRPSSRCTPAPKQYLDRAFTCIEHALNTL
jgi:hypothetical protein